MEAVFVLDSKGRKLMPTFNFKKVRLMLKDGRAKIYEHEPFTIQLQKEVEPCNQPIEYCTDTGSVHVGASIKSEKHEYVHAQFDLPDDEKQRHDDRRTARRTRRNRRRHRPPRFNNRKKDKGWFAPSIQHKIDNQYRFFHRYIKVCPITEAYLEVGKFDTQVLQALEEGKPVPKGLDYQHGPKYGHDTRKEAVFYRDRYKCQICGKSPFTDEGTILVIHHRGYWRGDHSNRMSNLDTLCTGCHVTSNHQKGAVLWGREPGSKSLADAAFMNTARWKLRETFMDSGIPVHITYGSVTKRTRLTLNMEKTHANDAFCIGKFRPKHKVSELHVKKRRRNDRCLETFKDARFIDSRDGSEKTGTELSCGRTRRKEPRRGPKNLRPYRKERVKKGFRTIRKNHYEIKANTFVRYENKVYRVRGNSNNGGYISLYIPKKVVLKDLIPRKDKDGKLLPIEVGQKLKIKGQKTPHKVLKLDYKTETATMEWFKAVPPDKVKPITYEYGGWKKVA